MDILYLTHRLPYPPNKGEKIRCYHHLRHLSRAHAVHLVSLIDRDEDEQWLPILREICHRVDGVRLRPLPALARGLATVAGGGAFSSGYFGSRALRAAVRRAATTTRFDVAWASTSTMAPYLTLARARRRIVDMVDVDSEKWRAFAWHSSGPWRRVYAIESRRVRQLERHAASADWVLFASKEEAALFRTFAPAGTRVRVVPNGVDTEFFRPPASGAGAQEPQILFTGSLDYYPNVDAVLFLARQILPIVRAEIPTVRLTAVGHRPARRLRREAVALADRFSLVGSVPDIRPYFATAHVYAAPLRIGRGVKNKILEAMATGVPVVASPCAVEGLAVGNGAQVLLANNAEEFAACIIAVLRDAGRARSLRESALQQVRERYRWASCLRHLDICLVSDS